MSQDARNSFSGYFGISPRLAPHMAFIFSDFTELGSEPERIVSWLRERAFGPAHRILDLGCGKGAAAIAVARELGCRVDGVDFYEPFIDEARAGAERAGVSHLCVFQAKNLRDAIPARADYDAVLYLAVGVALGGPGETIAAMRRCVRAGGLMILDDGYSTAGRSDLHGYEDMRSCEETLQALESCGDVLVKEFLITPEAVRAQNRRYQAWIDARARELILREPGLAGEIEAYLRKEREESLLLETRIQCATWMIERAD